ncbi:Carbon-nitrogen hydrolase, partial [Irineochytrium annulatum]
VESMNLDLLILPEMIFPGYVFKSSDDIRPFLEDPKAGPSITWAAGWGTGSSHLSAIGFPRHGGNASTANDTPLPHRNSVAILSRAGELLHIYDKHFLYETDETWASEGPSFSTVPLIGLDPARGSDGVIKMGVGICMDLNPWKFKAPFDAMEFGTYMAGQGVGLISCSMAWLTSPLDDDEEEEENDGWRTVEYWATRLKPVIENTRGKGRDGR